MINGMTPIPNVPVYPGSDKWIYKILDEDNQVVFEGTINDFIDKYLA